MSKSLEDFGNTLEAKLKKVLPGVSVTKSNMNAEIPEELWDLRNDHSKPEPYMGQTWPEYWEGATAKLATEKDWSHFRRHSDIVFKIEEMWSGWYAVCEEAGVEPRYAEDTLIGDPHTEKIKEYPKKNVKVTREGLANNKTIKVTPNSLRAGYYIHRISAQRPSFNNGPIKVLEVGPGYGGFAAQLCRRYEVADYYMIDAPIMQELQKYYMGKSGYGSLIHFAPPLEKVDLIVSTNSLGEFSLEEVTKYIRLFENVLKPETGLLYLQQRKEVRGHILTAWEDYPFDMSKWDLTVNESVKNHIWIEVFGKLL